MISLEGRRITRVRRVLHVGPNGTIDPTEGRLEFGLDFGDIAHFHVGDGEKLALSTAPLSESGSWKVFDITAEARNLGLLGEINDVDVSPFANVRLLINTAVLYLEVDDGRLIVHTDDGELLYPEAVKAQVVIPDWFWDHFASHMDH